MNFTGANLADADLARANLSYADLRGANLRGANLADALFWFAKDAFTQWPENFDPNSATLLVDR